MAKGLPSGTVTFLFTDIESSTRLVRDLGDDRYSDLIDQHHAVLRDVWARHCGVEVLTEGDAFFVAFADATDAVGAAVDAQRAVAGAVWPTDEPVRVRMGLHAGYAKPVDDDYRALAVHQAARIADAANGGQVFSTGEVLELAGLARAGSGVDVVSLGRFRVRDFDEPVALFRVSAPDVVDDPRPPRVRPADSHNLVRPGTSMVNRTVEQVELSDAVGSGKLVTLLGPGGVGKTRLSIEMGFQLVDRWPDGVWFVDLSAVSADEVLAMAVANAVGAPSTPGNDAEADLLAHAADRSMLVILDNCEHVAVPVARLVSQLRSACPRLGVLATSRVAIGLLGEVLYRLDPLGADVEGDAVRLFLERSGQSGDAADGLAGDDIAALCRAVDGLPLAIELAASRAHLLTPAEMVERMRSGVGAVSTRDPTLPPRQQSLDQLLDWSFDLLDAEELLVLTRLAVIADGFDLALGEAVAGDERVPARRVPELIWTLIDSSLVQREVAAGSSRFRLFGTVRAYVLESADAAEIAAARRRLATELSERLGPERISSRRWVTAMGFDLENVRAVVDDPDTDDLVARSLAWAVGQFHDVTSAYRSGMAEITRCVARRPEPGPALVALLTLQADLHLRLGEVDTAVGIVDRAAAMAEAVGVPSWDDTGVARTKGEIALRRGDVEAAARLADEALAAGSSTPRGEARLWNLVAITRHTLGDLTGASEALDQCLRAEEAAGLDSFLATTHGNYAEALLALEDPVGAARHQLASLELARSMGQPTLIAYSQMVAARFALDDGAAADAARLQAAADVTLARGGVSLYAGDEELRVALLEAAREALGEADFEQAVREGAASPADVVADQADSILRRRADAPRPTTTTGG